jgi:hypothetical protein
MSELIGRLLSTASPNSSIAQENMIAGIFMRRRSLI